MQYLTRKGVVVNRRDEARGFHVVGPPLFYATRQGQVEKMRWLLGHGADPGVEERRRDGAPVVRTDGNGGGIRAAQESVAEEKPESLDMGKWLDISAPCMLISAHLSHFILPPSDGPDGLRFSALGTDIRGWWNLTCPIALLVTRNSMHTTMSPVCISPPSPLPPKISLHDPGPYRHTP